MERSQVKSLIFLSCFILFFIIYGSNTKNEPLHKEYIKFNSVSIKSTIKKKTSALKTKKVILSNDESYIFTPVYQKNNLYQDVVREGDSFIKLSNTDTFIIKSKQNGDAYKYWCKQY